VLVGEGGNKGLTGLVYAIAEGLIAALLGGTDHHEQPGNKDF
jgi:hypothetical protein